MRKTLAAATLVAMGYCGAPVLAANIVANGDFASEPSGGPPVSPPNSWHASGNAGADQTLPAAGDAWDGFFGDPSGTLYQSLTTTPGVTYMLSFNAAGDGAALADSNSGFFVCLDPTATSCNATSDLFGENIVSDLTTPRQYQQFTDTITATGSSMYLSFTGVNGAGGDFYLDDVSLTPVPAPEPSDLLVLATALGLLTLARTRRA